MSNVQVQVRADTATNLAAATPAAAELGVDSTRNRLAVGDGLTAGGFPHAKITDAQGYGFVANYALAASVSSNNLTLALKTAAGSDASAANSIFVPFRSATLATGTPSFVEVTGALSIVIASGDTLGTANGVPFRFWIVLFNSGGTPVLGAINCLVGGATPTQIVGLDESTLQSPSASIGNNAGVFYSGASVSSSSPFRILGYIEYSSGLSTAGTYNSAPSKVQLFGPGVRKPGDIVQRVFLNSSSITAVTLAGSLTATNVAASITPTSAVNVVEFDVSTDWQDSGGAGALSGNDAQVYRGSTAVGNLAHMSLVSSSGFEGGPLNFNGYDAPASTSSVTYTLKGANLRGSNGGTIPWQGSGSTGSATVRLREIMV